MLLLSLAVHLAYTALGIGAGSALVDTIVNRCGQQVVMVRRRRAVRPARAPRRPGPPDLARARRSALGAVGGSATRTGTPSSYTVEDPPFPSPADAGWLAFYPFAYLCLGLHARRTARGLPASMWLDGLVGVLAVAARGHRRS